MSAYYNENNAFAALWIGELIKMGLVADGEVDNRSIKEVDPDDLKGFTQCHWFAGIAGWAYAARLAGWPDDRPLWTGSCPCQPFAAPGKRKGVDDPRHLWPDLFRLIRAARPAVVVGEQVASAAGYGWFDGVSANLEEENYTSRSVDIPALAVDSPQQRNRLYWIAVRPVGQADSESFSGRTGLRQAEPVGHGDFFADGYGLEPGPVASSDDGERYGRPVEPIGREVERIAAERDVAGERSPVAQGDSQGIGRREGRPESVLQRGRSTLAGADASGEPPVTQGDSFGAGLEGFGRDGDRGHKPRWVAEAESGSITAPNGSFWSASGWIVCHDEKLRRVPEPGVPLLAHGVSARVAKWSGLGNAIVPELAAEVLKALMDVLPEWSP